MLRINSSPLRRLCSVTTSRTPALSSRLVPSATSLSCSEPRRRQPQRLLSTLATLRYSDEVRAALDSNQPIVALESTIISHGMPYPQNYQTAIEVEKVVRDNGATPATIAIIDGDIHIGLSQNQIQDLSKLGRIAVKASRRDLAVVMAKKQTGATTVSATMLLAHRAGISVFATGGIGGVHRGYEQTMDASADLTELGRTPVAVVCAGVKSILDIGRTLEFLETQGVTVATMLNIETPKEVAELIAANQAVDLQSGIIIGVPIPEADAMDDDIVGEAINVAVKEAEEQKIFGKEITPFLLKRVNELTGGNSLKSNIALIKHNASVAAKIAKDLSSMSPRSGYSARSYSTSARRMHHDQAGQGPIMVIGGTVVDITATAHDASSSAMLNSSYPGTTRISLGGVGRNVAEGVSKLNPDGCVFVSAVGSAAAKQEQDSGSEIAASDDLFGPWLMNEVGRRGLRNLEIHQVPGARTATYTALHDSTGNLLSAVADMGVFELLPPERVLEAIVKHKPETICFDGNLSVDCMRTILEASRAHNIKTKCTRLLDPSMRDILLDGALHFASPNEYELQKMAIHARQLVNDNRSHAPEDVAVEKKKEENSALNNLLLDALSVTHFIPTLFIKLGAEGVLVFQRTGRVSDGLAKNGQVTPADLEDRMRSGVVRWRPFPAHNVDNIRSVTGAGDSFVASVVTSLHNLDRQGSLALTSSLNHSQLWKHMDLVVKDGQTAATLTMQTHETVSPALGTSAQWLRLQTAKNA
ncbi:hypothetical protein BGZ99_008090 [Dissophora globulifera]|uniref:Carbohydrate kinase PfkB domain-containing protein n=1 Tax=Dissophora globulifera TaxID=979702 RepID=A0A9P6RA30_9FUNG|nr:hypothetical protein BGZ99_008090 [Dissophora globulifera]